MFGYTAYRMLHEAEKKLGSTVYILNLVIRGSYSKKSQILDKTPMNLIADQQPITMILNISSQEYIQPKSEHHYDISKARSLYS